MGTDSSGDVTGILNPPLVGDFRTYPFPFLLGRIFREHLDGYLRVKQGELKKEIAFKKGNPVEVRSNILNETLGRFLRRIGKITPEIYDESFQRVGTEHKKHGEILIEMGVLSPHELNQLLQQQTLERIMDIFSWNEGTYRFYPNSEVKEPDAVLEFGIPVIMFRGISASFPVERVIAFLGSHREQALIPSPTPFSRVEEMKLKPAELRFLKAIDGKKTIGNLLNQYGEDIARLLYALIVLGIFIPEADPEVPSVSPPPVEKAERKAPPVEEKPAAPPPRPEPSEPAPSPPIPPPEPAEQEGDATVLSEMQAVYDRIRDQDYFGILGVEQGAPLTQIKKSYFQMAKKYHPDHYSNYENAEINELANMIFSMASRAFSEIGNEEGRKRHLDSLQSPTKDEDFEAGAQNLVNAEIQFQKGEMFLKEKKLDEAIEAFEWSRRLNPDEPEYQMQLGWALYKKYSSVPAGEKKVNQAVHLIERSVKDNPKLDRGFYYLGVINKLRGNEAEAEQNFQRSVDLNPQALDAQRELRVFQMRKEKTTEKKKKPFGRFFKR